MRMMLGLVTPTSGTATFGGYRYADLPHPSVTVGAVLDSAGFHPAHDHLRVYARMGRYGTARVEQVATGLLRPDRGCHRRGSSAAARHHVSAALDSLE